LVTPLDQQVAALVALVSISLIGIQFAIIHRVWQLFERGCLALPRKERNYVALSGLWVLLPIFIIEGIFIYSRIYVPTEYSNDAFMFLLIIFALLLLFSSFVVWIIRKVRKTKAHKPDKVGLYSFLSIFIFIASIFCSILALMGVSATMLNVEAGPYGPQNYTFGKWILLSAITFFFLWMFLHAYAFVEDYLKKRRKSLDY